MLQNTQYRTIYVTKHASNTTKRPAPVRSTMTGDRTLDDFSGEAETEGRESTTEADEGEKTTEADESTTEAVDEPLGSSPDPEAEPAEAEPAVSTYRWTPDGAACDDCGETVERRWLDDGDYVCAGCKEW